MNLRLSKLPGRRAFERRVRKLLTPKRNNRVSVIHIDLDRFEDVSHVLGRGAWRDLLTQAADRLRALGSSCYVARLDSDHLALLAHSTEPFTDLATRAVTVLAGPFHLGAERVTITASAGVADSSVTGSTNALMSFAGAALQWAKADGTATCRFEHHRNAEEGKRRQLRLALPTAMDSGQITLLYQPLVDLRSGYAIGAEALARWTHPAFGVIPPETFIGIAEETGRIVALGALLLKQACAAAVTWKAHDDRPAPYISVNVAAAQLRDPSFVAIVTNILQQTGLTPERLQLEITEHTLVDPCQITMQNLQSLKLLGVRIAIDDFGTGYNNLATLLNLPIHELKLANSFVRDSSRDLLTTIMMLRHTLNVTMTAEGVETERQASLLRTLGCDTGQGWHFSRPMTQERIRRYLCVNSTRPTLPRARRRSS